MSDSLPDKGWKWKWALTLLSGGALGMTIALLIAGYEQSFNRVRRGRFHLAGLLRRTNHAVVRAGHVLAHGVRRI